MEASELIALWPLVAATLTPMAGFVLGLVAFLHRDSLKTRDLIERSNRESRDLIERSNRESRDLIERSNKESRDLIERSNKETREECVRQVEAAATRLSDEFAEHKRVTEDNHRATQDELGRINASLGDARERLARIEGHLAAQTPQARDPDPSRGQSHSL